MLLFTAVASAGILRHALIVGANDGGGTLDPLRYAEMDAQRVSDVLLELGGFDPADITVLYAPTPAELKDALHQHADAAARAPDDMFIFYYSGHADVRGLRLDADLYTFEALKADIRAMPAEVKLGILDACRSGTITRLKGAQLAPPFLLEEQLAAEGEAWMTAASADEEAQESDQLRGSFFTHYLLSGLRGAADTGDGTVSLDEAYAYAFDRVVDHTGGTEAGVQHPNFDYRLKGQGDLRLTAVAQGRSTLTFPAELGGHITVLRMPDRTPVAEVAKTGGTPSVLALAPGNYLLRLRESDGRTFREALVGLADGARLTVSRWGAANMEVGAMKGETVARDAWELARETTEHPRTWLANAWNGDDLRHSPMIAGSVSVLLPGAGQMYNGQWGKGFAYLGATTALLGTSLVVSGDQGQYFHGAMTGPDFLRLTSAMLYLGSVADASYNARRQQEWRPYTGATIATASAWSLARLGSPAIAGVTIEWIPVKPFGLALERVGWTSTAPGQGDWGFGGRGSWFFVQGAHLRPALFVAVGARYHRDEGRRPSDVLLPTLGAGAALRWYVTPRYFVEWEDRVETNGGTPQNLFGGGLGVHFGG